METTYKDCQKYPELRGREIVEVEQLGNLRRVHFEGGGYAELLDDGTAAYIDVPGEPECGYTTALPARPFLVPSSRNRVRQFFHDAAEGIKRVYSG